MITRLPLKTTVTVMLMIALLLAVAASASAAPNGPVGASIHVVQPGETLYSVARTYGMNASEVAQANYLVNPNMVYVGQRLVIPGAYGYAQPAHAYAPQSSYAGPQAYSGNYGYYRYAEGTTYVVQPGDTLYSIAVRYGTTVEAIARANNISYSYLIYAGQILIIPSAGPAPTTIVKPAIIQQYDPAKPAQAQYYHYMPAAEYPPPDDYGTTEAYLLQAPRGVVPALIKQVTHLEPAWCNEDTKITFPRQGEVLDGLGTWFITGTASIDRFQFYKLELGHGEHPIEFWSIDEVQKKPIINGVLLDGWNTGALPEGTYTLRLTVVDESGQYPQPCDVTVHIKH